jgi:hypothetical protein
MKSMTLYCGSVLALALLMMGCEKKQESPSAPVANEKVGALAPAQPPAEPEKVLAATALDMAKVPVEEQFEKDVESEVTPANLEQQLDSVEKELQTK